MALKAGAEEDIRRAKPVIERVREWEHGDGGAKDCFRRGRLVHTPPGQTPGPCRDWSCGNEEWRSRGIVARDAKSKRILHRES